MLGLKVGAYCISIKEEVNKHGLLNNMYTLENLWGGAEHETIARGVWL
jgi:hypothetical protein